MVVYWHSKGTSTMQNCRLKRRGSTTTTVESPTTATQEASQGKCLPKLALRTLKLRSITCTLALARVEKATVVQGPTLTTLHKQPRVHGTDRQALHQTQITSGIIATQVSEV